MNYDDPFGEERNELERQNAEAALREGEVDDEHYD